MLLGWLCWRAGGQTCWARPSFQAQCYTGKGLVLLWEPHTGCSPWPNFHLCFGNLGSLYLPCLPFLIAGAITGQSSGWEFAHMLWRHVLCLNYPDSKIVFPLCIKSHRCDPMTSLTCALDCDPSAFCQCSLNWSSWKMCVWVYLWFDVLTAW